MLKVLFVSAVLAATPAWATDFVPATPAEAAAALTADDDFMRALTPSDLSVRLKKESATVDELRVLYAASTLAWTEAEKARLTASVARQRAGLDKIAKWLPPRVAFAKTSTDVDGGLPHTRGATIIFGPALPQKDEELDLVFLHELFHVLSRRNAARQDEIYGIIGFEPCRTVNLPQGVRERMLTNPDAPLVQHAVATGNPGEMLTPLLLTTPPRYTPDQPNFDDYIDLRFVLLKRSAAGDCSAFAIGEKLAELDAKNAVPIIIEHAGRNTGYVFHPEELMADNFWQLMMGAKGAPDPWVHERLALWLGIAKPKTMSSGSSINRTVGLAGPAAEDPLARLCAMRGPAQAAPLCRAIRYDGEDSIRPGISFR